MTAAMLVPILMQVLPVLLPLLAPLVTNLTERLVALIGSKLPGPAKPIVNVLAGAALAGLVGGDPTTGVVASMVGNRVREAINKSAAEEPHVTPKGLGE